MAGGPPGIVFVNHRFETFTPTRSGAICTIIHELCVRARSEIMSVTVLSSTSHAEQYQDTPVVSVEAPVIPTDPLGRLAVRFMRKLSGYRELGHGQYILRTIAAIHSNRLDDLPKVAFNDPELAISVARALPQVRPHFPAQTTGPHPPPPLACRRCCWPP